MSYETGSDIKHKEQLEISFVICFQECKLQQTTGSDIDTKNARNKSHLKISKFTVCRVTE